MGKIRVLPEILAHKIAAGEIVERPSSVVKELVENSLDAGSTKIDVEVEAGGKRRITVRDNGIGMAREDAETAFLHHATSKVQSIDDLFRISTLGFRGEALPSIASVSRLLLRTVERDLSRTGEPLGTEIQFEGGKKVCVRDISWPEGTQIQVDDLFYNVPARRKFLRSESTELSHISRQMVHYSLANPETEFRFSHEGKSILTTPAVDSLQDRIYQVMGKSFLENLVPVELERDGVRVWGFTSLPHEQRANNRSQYLFVNRRIVRDRVITHALRLAYQDLIPSRAFPVVILFVEMDAREVDVNVHPSKIEIRFRESDRVHRAIYHAVEAALLKNRSHFGALARDFSPHQFHTLENPGPGGLAQRPGDFFQTRPDSSLGFPQFRRSAGFGPLESGARVAGLVYGSRPEREVEPGDDVHCSEIPETAHISPIPVVLGQFVESFIVAADRQGVMLIDQHVAHERILFDTSLQKFASGQSVATQRLLVPLTVELSAEQASAMSELIEHLNANGFEVEWFGEKTVVIKGVPDLAAQVGDFQQLLEQILDDFREYDDDSPDRSRVQRLREKLAISLSCRSAVKVNTPLSLEKMQWMIDALFRCANPYTCPHGRPIVLRLNVEDILRSFKRI